MRGKERGRVSEGRGRGGREKERESVQKTEEKRRKDTEKRQDEKEEEGTVKLHFTHCIHQIQTMYYSNMVYVKSTN